MMKLVAAMTHRRRSTSAPATKKPTKYISDANTNRRSTVSANTDNARENVNTLRSIDGRVTDLEAWKLRKEGYDAAMADIAKQNADGQ